MKQAFLDATIYGKPHISRVRHPILLMVWLPCFISPLEISSSQVTFSYIFQGGGEKTLTSHGFCRFSSVFQVEKLHPPHMQYLCFPSRRAFQSTSDTWRPTKGRGNLWGIDKWGVPLDRWLVYFMENPVKMEDNSDLPDRGMGGLF